MKKTLIFSTFVFLTIILVEAIVLTYITHSPSILSQSKPEPSAYNYWVKKKPMLIESTKSDISEGVITAIDKAGGSIEVAGTSYDYALKLDLKNSKGATYTYIYDKTDLGKTVISDKTKKLNVADLVIGDTIVIKETINLLSTNSATIAVDIQKK